MTKIEVFDLDHTLIKKNSSFQFAIYLYRKGAIPFVTMLFFLWNYFLFTLGRISIVTLLQRMYRRFLQGKSLSMLDRYSAEFTERYFHQLVNLPVYELLKKAKEAGHYTVLLSSSPEFLVKKFALYFQVDECGATTYDVKHDRIESMSEMMEGKNKVKYINDLCGRLGVQKESITAYSDSIRDLPLLEMAGHAIAVNPDPQLRKICRTNKWKVM